MSDFLELYDDTLINTSDIMYIKMFYKNTDRAKFMIRMKEDVVFHLEYDKNDDNKQMIFNKVLEWYNKKRRR